MQSEKQFDAVQFMRTQREKLAEETEDMSSDELKKYFTEHNELWQKLKSQRSKVSSPVT